MVDESLFEAAVLADPLDALAWRAWADWLEEIRAVRAEGTVQRSVADAIGGMPWSLSARDACARCCRSAGRTLEAKLLEDSLPVCVRLIGSQGNAINRVVPQTALAVGPPETAPDRAGRRRVCLRATYTPEYELVSAWLLPNGSLLGTSPAYYDFRRGDLTDEERRLHARVLHELLNAAVEDWKRKQQHSSGS